MNRMFSYSTQKPVRCLRRFLSRQAPALAINSLVADPLHYGVYASNQTDETIASFPGNEHKTSLTGDNTVSSNANDVKVNPVIEKIYSVGSVNLTILTEE